MKRLFWIIGITSFSIIAFQLALMRYLSIIHFYHYAYMIISVALLGFGAGGIMLFLIRDFFFRNYSYVLFFASVILFALILYSTSIVNKFSFDPFFVVWDHKEYVNILLFYFTIFLPFFFAAIILCLSFMKYPEIVNKLYFLNLIGSAIGGVGIVLMMFLFKPFYLNVIIASSLLINIVLCVSLLENKFLPFSLFGICLFLLIFNLIKFSIKPNFSDYKTLSKTLKLPEANIVSEMFSPEGWIVSVSSPALRFAPGLSLTYNGDIPAQVGVFNDGDGIGTIFHDTLQNVDFLKKSTLSLPYLFQVNEVLIVGTGTGTEIIRAIRNSAGNIIGIEVNSLLVEIASEFLKSYLPDDSHKRFKILNKEVRSFIKQTEKSFDLIFYPLMEGFSSSAAGYYSLFENYLLTVESISDAIQKINENGFLCMNVWTNYPPRHAIKLFALVVDSFKKNDIDPQYNILAIRSWNTVTLLAKKSSFIREEIELVKNFCNENYFDLIYYPGIQDQESNIYNILEEDFYYKSFKKIFSARRDRFEREYFFNIKTPTDDQPYFSNFIKAKTFLLLLSEYGMENLPLYEWGYLLLLLAFIQIFLLSGFFIIAPVFFITKYNVNLNTKIKVLLYFGGIGLGFMFIEILLIQKFILFLGHPIYSVSMVISSILLFAGIGSLYSLKIISFGYLRIKTIAICLILLTVVYYFGLPQIFNLLESLSVINKYLLSFLTIAPLAFMMGIFFPAGIKNLSQNYKNLIPLAWGVNGVVSVIASVLAPILAIEMGFRYVMLIACVSYSIIIFIAARFK